MPPKSRRPILIAAVLAVVLILVLVAVLFVFVLGGKPTVQFGAPIGGGSSFIVYVASASQARPASSYRLNILVGGTAGSPVPLAYYTNLTVAGDTYQALWGDLDFNGQVTAGDGFGVLLAGGGSFPAPITLQLLWSDGSVVGSVVYTPSGPSRPVVTFSAPNANPTGFGFQAAGVSQRYAASFYEVALEVNTTLSLPVTLSASMAFTVGADSYTINWTDVESSGDLTAGDAFDVSHAGGLPPATTFTVYLIWSDDGSTIATVSYTT